MKSVPANCPDNSLGFTYRSSSGAFFDDGKGFYLRDLKRVKFTKESFYNLINISQGMCSSSESWGILSSESNSKADISGESSSISLSAARAVGLSLPPVSQRSSILYL